MAGAKAGRKTLWSATKPDEEMFAYTAGSDQTWDGALLKWDVLGSLGHVEGLARSRLLSRSSHQKLRRALRTALAAVENGKLRLGTTDEDVHTAVENWLTARYGRLGEMVHTGRSRNDQVCADLRLFLKDRLLTIHGAARGLVDALLGFARREQRTLWPGYTHTRRAMPTSGALWAGGLAEGILNSLETLPFVWVQVDRSPLGSAAGYGVPLPLNREATAKALGFAGLDQVVTSTQNGRGRVEAAVIFWCAQLAHDMAKLSSDIILFSADELGYFTIPADLVTGSSIMPHKRNPDVLELTRARASQVDADLAAILLLRGKLTSGYHRDFQLLKEPLMSGLERTEAMLWMLARVIPRITVNRSWAAAALERDTLATDEVMRRVELGEPFRRAYRDVANALKQGIELPLPPVRDLFARRGSTGGLGNPQLPMLSRRNRALARWEASQSRRFRAAMNRLAGRKGM